MCRRKAVIRSLPRNTRLEKCWASQVAQEVKNLPANVGDTGDMGSIPRSGRIPGIRNGNPLQHSCLKNPKDWGAWCDTVHGVAKSWTWLSTHMHTQQLLQTHTKQMLLKTVVFRVASTTAFYLRLCCLLQAHCNIILVTCFNIQGVGTKAQRVILLNPGQNLKSAINLWIW